MFDKETPQDHGVKFGPRASIPGQLVGIAITAIGDMLWYPLIFIMLWYLDEIMLFIRDEGLHWAVWVVFWGIIPCVVGKFILFRVKDVDGNGLRNMSEDTRD